jgi:hypothetical protein
MMIRLDAMPQGLCGPGFAGDKKYHFFGILLAYLCSCA